MLLNRNVPSVEFFLGQIVNIQGLVAGDQLGADGAHDGGLAAGDPAAGFGVRKVGPRHHGTVRKRHGARPIYLFQIHANDMPLRDLPASWRTSLNLG